MDNSSLLQKLRHHHTTSLDHHSPSTVPKHHSRSSDLLPSRTNSPAFPAFTLDSSLELVMENKERRQLHSRLMERDPSVFRKRCVPESSSSLLKQRSLMNDFMSGMHGLRDIHDLNKQRAQRVTFSIRRDKDLKDKQDLEEHLFHNLPPIEDFLRPHSPVTPRTTGYEVGHIRSLLKVDTFGPANSLRVSRERESGQLPPHSPNVDRFRNESVAGSVRLMTGSRASTTSGSKRNNNTNNNNNNNNLAENRSSLGSSISSMKDLFHYSSADLINFENNNNNNMNSRAMTPAGTLGYYGPAYSEDEKLLVDPLLKRKTWHKSYVSRVKQMQTSKQVDQQRQNYNKQQMSLAEKEKREIEKFEKHLVLAKIKIV